MTFIGSRVYYVIKLEVRVTAEILSIIKSISNFLPDIVAKEVKRQ